MPPADGIPATSAGVKPWRNMDLSCVSPCADRYGQVQLFTQWGLQAVDGGGLPLGPIRVPMDEDLEINTETVRLCRGHWPASRVEVERVRSGEADAGCEECWWTVNVCARELVSDLIQPTVAQPFPVIPDRILAPRGVPTTRLKALVEWIKAGFGCKMIVDIGTAFRFAVEGSDVTVSVLGPRGATRVVGGLASNIAVPVPAFSVIPGFAQVVLNTVVTGQVTRCEATSSDRSETVSQLIRVDANVSDVDVKVPPRARFVQVSLPTPGVTSPVELVVAPTGDVVREIFFNPFTNARSTDEQGVSQEATHLRLATTPQAIDRLYSILWRLEL